ncbi:hypothetical protein MMC18_009687 [Xylographa bjoerkii]|nr:hypothetical protein [Xylographa bjoerkii]
MVLAYTNRQYSDNQKVVIKSPLRDDPQREYYTRHELKQEINLLRGPFKGQAGIRQLVDQIRLVENRESIDASVLEYGEMSLHEVQYEAKRPLSSNQVKSIARQLLQALAFMHGHGIVHTDIKPQNIVFTRLPDGFDTDLEVKLIDVGTASDVSNEWSDQKDNIFWRSPESWLEMPLTPAVEIWALGAIIGSLLLGPESNLFRPLNGPTNSDEESKDNWLRSVHALFPMPESFLERAPKAMRLKIDSFSNNPPRLPDGRIITSSLLRALYHLREYDWKFVEAMLKVDPDQRPTAKELLRYSWLQPPLPFYHPQRLYSRFRLAVFGGVLSILKRWNSFLDRIVGEDGARSGYKKERDS